MKKIIFFTKTPSILKHWEKALAPFYTSIHMTQHKELEEYLQEDSTDINVMIDLTNIEELHLLVDALNHYEYVHISLFSTVPKVTDALPLLKYNIQGYENAYLDKINLFKMLNSIESGKNWFFAELTNYIIKQFMQKTQVKAPDFIDILTEKEKNIAFMIADGLTNKEIAQTKSIALSTVKGHIKHIFEKANVSDRVSLALKFK